VGVSACPILAFGHGWSTGEPDSTDEFGRGMGSLPAELSLIRAHPIHPCQSVTKGESWRPAPESGSGSRALPPEGPPVRLCLIGSAACLFEGMPGCASRDLDVWVPESDFDRKESRDAVERSGLLFDPRDVLDPDRPYLQLVTPGPTQMGEVTPVLWVRMGLNFSRWARMRLVDG
jgi:hypothetical protein